MQKAPFKILFVCLGNICRSPAAEAIMNHLIEGQGLSGRVSCESAGTSAYHAGAPADARMREHGERRGYQFVTPSRPLRPEDIDAFDLIVVMDRRNLADVQAMIGDDDQLVKVVEMADYSDKISFHEIPDPYFGGDAGFELVLDLLEDGCASLLRKICK